MPASPAYHLRLNKNVERRLQIELFRLLDRYMPTKISDYTYVSLGGPYLEDFHSMYSEFGTTKMISLETDPNVILRQKINRPHSKIKLENQSTSDFVNSFNFGTKKLIIWFDYSKPEWQQQISECCDLLRIVPVNSIFKVTLICNNQKLKGNSPENKLEGFNEMFSDFGPFNPEDIKRENFTVTLFKIFRKSIAAAVPDSNGRIIRSLTSFSYDDGTPILTITMLIGSLLETDRILKGIKSWNHLSPNWELPQKIDIPVLSIRERIKIESLYPSSKPITILKKLKIKILENEEQDLDAIINYLKHCRQIPHFLRVNP